MVKRREFVKKALASALGTTLGSSIVFGSKMAVGYVPLVFRQGADNPFLKHEEMVVLNDRPWNVEAQAHLLDDPITPAAKMFVRNNGRVPETIDASKWMLTVDGESVIKPKTYTLSELKSKFRQYTTVIRLKSNLVKNL